MKFNYLLWLVFFLSINGYSQETKMSIKEYVNFSDLPIKNNGTPSWADQFYSNPDLININRLKKEINDWVTEEKKERKKKSHTSIDTGSENDLKESISENPIVRFALNFVKKIPGEWINESGTVDLPSKDIFLKNADNQEKTRSIINQKNALSNNWSQIGSTEIVINDVQTVQSTNIYYISIAPSATNTRLASTETGTLFKTTDGGANWLYLNDYTGPSAFHPTDANKIILGSNPFRISSNGGSTWASKPVAANCNKVLWSNDGTTILAATEQGIYVSKDGGLTFSVKQTGNFMDIKFKPGSSVIGYAITNAGIFYKSTDGGLTWFIKTTNYTLTTSKDGYLLGVSDANPNLVSIAFLTDLKTEIIKSVNSGENFTPLSVYETGFSQGYYDFVFGISPTDANIYFLGVTTLFKSTNGGLNFTAIGGYDGSFDIHPDMQDLVLFGNNVVIATDGGVSVSSDNFTSQANWRSTCKGLYVLDYWGFDVGFNTDQMGGGKYHNGNNIFNPTWNNGKSIDLGGGESAVGKAIFSRPNAMFFAEIYKGFEQIDVDYNPLHTRSNPFTLENNTFYYGTRNSDTTSNAIYSNIIYSGTENNVLISYDNGATSQILKNFNSLVWDVKTTRNNANVLYVMTENDGLWKTTDAGVNWNQCNTIVNNVDLKTDGLGTYIDVSQTNANEIWITNSSSDNVARVFKSTDGGQVWTSMNTTTLDQFQSCQIVHQYGSNGGVYLMGKTNGISKCYYRNNSMPDWTDYSANLMVRTSLDRVFLKATYYKEKLRVAGPMGVQEISFYEKSSPVAQPTTNVKDVCVNQEIKFADFSILNYSGATWRWSFSKTPTYLNGTSATSQNPIVKFLSPGTVDVTVKITNNSGISDTKTIPNFITVNYETSSCLLLNSDHDYVVNCVNNSAPVSNIAVGGQALVTNFNGATTGKYLVNLNLYTNCSGFTASLNALVDLDTNQIKVIRYSHFDDGVLAIPVTGDNTSTVYSASVRWAGVSFSLNNKSLYITHLSNYCASIGEVNKTVTLQQSCWKPYGTTGIDNGDLTELQKCNNPIPPSAIVTNTNDILVTDFGNTTSGLFYVNINGFTYCNNTSNNLQAIINLDSDIIHVLNYKHFGNTTASSVAGNETSSVTSTLLANAQVNYFINNKKLYIKRISDACTVSNFKLNQSCWTAMDDDQNGVDNAAQPSNCNNPLSTILLTDANLYLIKNFSSLAATQAGVFVKINISTSCNNTTATAYLSVDLDNNLIHFINYRHFGATTSSPVLNNDTPNVYSESAENGKLKFVLINDNLYIQRISNPCAGSNYQVTNSCYATAADQVLVINEFISNSTTIAYPNPTKGIFTIETKTNSNQFNLSFYSLDGKFITPQIEKIENNLLQINMEQYAHGLYFVIVCDKVENKYSYLKIIKE